MSVKLVEVIRSGTVESIHRGDIAVLKHDGTVLYSAGDINHVTFMRSAAKPIQAIGLLEAGIADAFGLELSEIALTLSSHSGEKTHIEALKKMMRKIGVEESDLRCGVHDPLSRTAALEIYSNGRVPTVLHCNCSGKHLGHIAALKAYGMSIENYWEPASGIQSELRNIISRFAGVEESEISMGTDGCGVPVYGIALRNMAVAYANLCNEGFMEGRYLKAQNYVVSSMTMYPEMIGGDGRLDTELMKNFGSRVVGKFGDEGVYCAGLIGKGVGIALKIEDGGNRAVGPAILETLVQIGAVGSDEMKVLKDFWNPPIKNHRGETVGEVKPAFSIRAKGK